MSTTTAGAAAAAANTARRGVIQVRHSLQFVRCQGAGQHVVVGQLPAVVVVPHAAAPTAPAAQHALVVRATPRVAALAGRRRGATAAPRASGRGVEAARQRLHGWWERCTVFIILIRASELTG